MEPWGVWLPAPIPRSALRRGRGEHVGSLGIPLAPWASAVGLAPATGFAGLPGLRGWRRLDPDACSPSGQCLPAQRPEAPRRPAQPHRGGTERQAAQTPAGTERHEAAMLEPAWGPRDSCLHCPHPRADGPGQREPADAEAPSSRRKEGAQNRGPQSDPPLWPCPGERGEPGSEEATSLSQGLHPS